MKLFGKRQKNGELKSKSKHKSKKKRKKLYKTPSDVKLFYYMPITLVISVFLMLVGFFWIQSNAAVYRAQIMASSMKYEEDLPLWGGQSKGQLSLGHTRLSKDGKTLAVEIRYDNDAHTGLSSFGNRYKLRLVDTTANRMKHLKMSYGIFGTDGSGVLTLHSKTGFKNAAFLVMIIDNGQLVTTDDLNDPTQLSDSDIDNSITAELSGSSDNSSTNSNGEDENRAKLPPLYYVRLNAHNAIRNYRNWNSDSEMIDDLFVRENLATLKSSMNKVHAKIIKANRTLDEMNRRIQENSHDQIARTGKQNIKSSLNDLTASYEKNKNKYQKLKNSIIASNILDPKQTHYHTYTVSDLNTIH